MMSNDKTARVKIKSMRYKKMLKSKTMKDFGK